MEVVSASFSEVVEAFLADLTETDERVSFTSSASFSEVADPCFGVLAEVVSTCFSEVVEAFLADLTTTDE